MNPDYITNTFIDLVKIDSPSGSEAELANYLVSRLTKIGLKFSTDPAGNLFSRIKGPGKPVIICAHLDTVEPGRGIKPQLTNGVFTSDGTTVLGADNKSAVAAIICALESLPEEKFRSLEIIFSVREETDSGISQFDFSQLIGRTGLIADRSSNIGSIVLSSPWILNLNLEIAGKASHAGRPEEGINALTVAAKAISETSWGRIDPMTTANIGLISGGSAINTVPEKVVMTGEIRSFSPVVLSQTRQRIKSVFTDISGRHHTKLKFSSTLYCNGYVYDQKDPAVRIIAEIMKKIDIIPFYETAFGASDANVFASHGIKVVTVGDGCIHPHTVHESVSVENLVRLTEFFKTYITYPNY